MTARYRAVFLAAIENNQNFSLSPHTFVLDPRLSSAPKRKGSDDQSKDLSVTPLVPEIGLEPTCREALAPETSVSTISPLGLAKA